MELFGTINKDRMYTCSIQILLTLSTILYTPESQHSARNIRFAIDDRERINENGPNYLFFDSGGKSLSFYGCTMFQMTNILYCCIEFKGKKLPKRYFNQPVYMDGHGLYFQKCY